MKFKTTAKCAGCEAAIRMKLSQVISDNDWSIDLDSADKVLTVTADVAPAVVVSAVEDAGIRIQLLD